MSGPKKPNLINKLLMGTKKRNRKGEKSQFKSRFTSNLIEILLLPWQIIKLILTEITIKVSRSIKRWRRGENPFREFKIPGLSQYWLLRSRGVSNSGFLLPMVAILLVVFSLVVGALLLQSVNRTTEVSSERNDQVVYNSATVAIDRAKAKIEYMFNQDPRWPRGLPGDQYIEYIMLNGDPVNTPPLVKPIDIDLNTPGTQDPYTFPDETRLDINNDGQLDNAWSFVTDSDGDADLTDFDGDGDLREDGDISTVAYTILSRVQDGSNTTRSSPDADKARELIVRNGPINMTQASSVACIQPINSDEGWDVITGATVRRAFQTFAVVVEDKDTRRNIATLEMQQDRQADKGNKWGAWFRNDLEIFPGPGFRWNGAIHTEGNLIIGDSNQFESFLISAPTSCLYARENSEITIGGNNDESTPPFLGQFIRGSLKTNLYAGSSLIHVHKANGPTSSDIYRVDDSIHIDSIRSSSPPPDSISLDPVVLFISDEDQSRNPTDLQNAAVRDSNWQDRPLFKEGRVFNRSAQAPYIDDTYRSDNRYGPNARYTQLIDLNGKKIGQKILNNDPNSNELLGPNAINPESSGLDGYWERRSREEGLTIIVGQRLELGNTYGWQGDQDPLYPQTPGYCPTSTRCHELKQWQTLRDNLAAVQSTIVYHNKRNASGNTVFADFPLACLATTAHPGARRSSSITDTRGTTGRSVTFSRVRGNINTNFLTGEGTNGWEFPAPANQVTDSGFSPELASGTPLRTALRNLANFAGDPDGAFPPTQDSDDGNNSNDAIPNIGPVVHPYPMFTMWGDYSNLRRAMDEIDSGVRYQNLSIADKATIQTASCTLGMLAYNLDSVLSFDYTEPGNQADILELVRALNDQSSVLDYIDNVLPGGRSAATAEDYIDALKNFQPTTIVSGNTKTNGELAQVAEAIYWKEQVTRDRRFGFYNYRSPDGADPLIGWSSITEAVNFDPAENGYFGLDPNTDANRIQRLARRLGPSGPKFPALFYIFPRYRHNHNATNTVDPLPLGATDITQPSTEPYINDGVNYVARVNNGVNYNAVTPSSIRLQPKTRDRWILPYSTNTTDRVNIIRDSVGFTPSIPGDPGSQSNLGVALLDKGFFNGREMMSVRGLDLDLDLLRNEEVIDLSGNSFREKWLPYSGIVYAFREDAVREDAIARPIAPGGSISNCGTAADIIAPRCRMDAVSTTPSDPPQNSVNGISTKPVDFYADPDRRPHGFRLRNGQDLRRPGAPSQLELRGLSFISDNPVYIVGDNNAFNLHADVTSGGLIEEFTQLLDNNWNNFYTRTTLNSNFAKANDRWRPAEIIADAITILSDNFVDGSIAEGIRERDIDGQLSSYRTLNAPIDETRMWIREDGSVSDYSDDDDYEIPIKISRQGYPLYCVEPGNEDTNIPEDKTRNSCLRNGNRPQEYGLEREAAPKGYNRNANRTYEGFNTNKQLINAQNNTRINATIVSGLVPSRGQQSYGGLHNFPRFIENWSGDNLFISGALIQLKFSVYGTGPFDQDSWDPRQTPAGAELIRYYGAPNRRWGYDVGLQYSPSGPVASRFITPSNTRSEFYREPPANDPYICALRTARLANRNSANIDPNTGDC